MGRSLAEVTDGPVRNKVQALVCDQLASHTLDQDNVQATKIMADIDKAVREYLTQMGITLDYIGWADTFTFDPVVQGALNRVYVADKDSKIAIQLGPQVGTLQAIAAAQATRTVSERWNGQMPTQVSLWWLPDSLSNFFTSVFSKGAAAK
jgi:hypothetical protein